MHDMESQQLALADELTSQYRDGEAVAILEGLIRSPGTSSAGKSEAWLGLAIIRRNFAYVVDHVLAHCLDEALRANPHNAEAAVLWCEMRWEAGPVEDIGYRPTLDEVLARRKAVLDRVEFGPIEPSIMLTLESLDRKIAKEMGTSL